LVRNTAGVLARHLIGLDVGVADVDVGILLGSFGVVVMS
jgi:hypothetical protein